MHLLKLFKKEIFILSFILLIAHLVQWYLIDFYFTNLPEHIPNTNFNIAGLSILIYTYPYIIFLSKKILQIEPSLNLLTLTIISGLTCLFAEIMFQLIRWIIEKGTAEEKVYLFF